MARTATNHKPGLYIAADGRVECHEHAPFPGSDTWLAGRYIKVTEPVERIAAEQGWPGPMRCEVCGATRADVER
jgi:hypothetical protein